MIIRNTLLMVSVAALAFACGGGETPEAEAPEAPAEAAEVAREAGVAQLALIHYPVREVDLEAWRLQAAGFPGSVTLAREGDRYPL